MDIKRRFLFFGSGFTVGIILLMFFLNGKKAACNFFPNARMLDILRKKERLYSEDVKSIMADQNIDSTEVANMLLKGDIDFSKSKVRQEPCRYYWIDGYLIQKEASMYVENCDSIVTIMKISFPTSN